MAFRQDGCFYPYITDKGGDSQEGLAAAVLRSHRVQVAEPGFQLRQFASQIYVLNHYFLPPHLPRLRKEIGLTPKITSLLVVLCEAKSVILVGDIPSPRHGLGGSNMPSTDLDRGDTVEGKWFYHPIATGFKCLEQGDHSASSS